MRINLDPSEKDYYITASNELLDRIKNECDEIKGSIKRKNINECGCFQHTVMELNLMLGKLSLLFELEKNKS
jgi:hypothetical protein